MQTVSHFLSTDHRRCDDLFATAEQAAQEENWAVCERDFHSFHASMEHHFMMEEQVLFPQLEELNQQVTGPVQVMRMEHEQMRDLFQQLAESVAQKDTDNYLGAAETLLAFMQQHNMKEEQILYTLADNVLGDSAQEAVQHMAEVRDS